MLNNSAVEVRPFKGRGRQERRFRGRTEGLFFATGADLKAYFSAIGSEIKAYFAAVLKAYLATIGAEIK